MKRKEESEWWMHWDRNWMIHVEDVQTSAQWTTWDDVMHITQHISKKLGAQELHDYYRRLSTDKAWNKHITVLMTEQQSDDA